MNYIFENSNIEEQFLFETLYHNKLFESEFISIDKIDLDHLQQSIDAIKRPGPVQHLWRSIKTFLNVIPGVEAVTSESDYELNQILRTMMPEIDIKSYMFNSSVPNAYTFPFNQAFGDKKGRILSELPIPFLSPALTIISNIEALFSALTADNYTWNVKGGRLFIKPNMDYLYVYSSTRIKEILDAREFIAVIFHEIGHNMWRKYNGINSIIKPFIVGLLMAPTLMFPFLGLIGGIAALIYLNYCRRICEDKSDVFAGQLGFGKDLASALGKMDEFFRGKSFIMGKWNILEHLISAINWVGWQIYRLLAHFNLASYSSIPDRQKQAINGEKIASGKNPIESELIKCIVSPLREEQDIINNNKIFESLIEKLCSVLDKASQSLSTAF